MLNVRYRLRSNNSSTGLQWSVLPVPSGRPAVVGLMSPSAEKFVDQSFPFETPPQPGPMRILLSYARLQGTTRMEGKLWIQSVQLTLIP